MQRARIPLQQKYCLPNLSMRTKLNKSLKSCPSIL